MHDDVKARLAARLLAWYDAAGRDGLPWRARPGEPADPYRVWISEIMLQQTTVAVVRPYFQAFVRRWPTAGDLAQAPLDDVLHAWQGLGYYARARNLHRAAGVIVARHGGRLPASVAELEALPGIGAYTARAVAAIAFDVQTTPVDGNIRRVLARLCRVATPMPAATAEIAGIAEALAPRRRPGDFAQALMDLGATLCTPRRPACLACPWRGDCAAALAGDAEAYPVLPPKLPRPARHGIAFWIASPARRVLFRRRPAEGLLGGMIGLPTTPWRAEPWPDVEAAVAAAALPSGISVRPLPGSVRHVFTHFSLDLRLMAAEAEAEWQGAGERWTAPGDFDGLALPTLFRKAVRLAGRPA